MADNHQNFFDLINSELAARYENGEPLRVHLVDANHTSAIPRELFADPRMQETLAQYGHPLFLPEMSSADAINSLVETYAASGPDDRQAIREALSGLGEFYHADAAEADRLTESHLDVFDRAAEGNEVFYPDPRLSETYTEQEQAMLTRTVHAMSETPNAGLCGVVAAERFEASLTPPELEVLASMSERFGEEATNGEDNTFAIDADITTNVDAYYPEAGAVGDVIPVMMYGANHYTKQGDLDELSDGVSVAILDGPGSMRIGMGANPDLHNDFPDYAYYTDTQRVVPLDTAEARAEALGYTMEEYAAWEKAATDGVASPGYEQPELSPDQLALCGFEPEVEASPQIPVFPMITPEPSASAITADVVPAGMAELSPDVLAAVNQCGADMNAAGCGAQPEEALDENAALVPPSSPIAPTRDVSAANAR